MIYIKSNVDARRGRCRDFKIEELPVWFTRYFGVEDEGDVSRPRPSVRPFAFLIEQDANTTLRPHFHRSDQFQVFVHGTGEFGKKQVHDVTIHYACAFAPYGPIRAGDHGLSYFTLRNGPDDGPRFMPESRGELPPPSERRRQFALPAFARTATDTLQRMESAALRPLIQAEPGGLGIWLHSTPPGAAMIGPSPRDGNGQYWLVLSGEMQTFDRALGQESCLFIPPEEPALTATARGSGCEVLVLQFEKRSLALDRTLDA